MLLEGQHLWQAAVLNMRVHRVGGGHRSEGLVGAQWEQLQWCGWPVLSPTRRAGPMTSAGGPAGLRCPWVPWGGAEQAAGEGAWEGAGGLWSQSNLH